MLLSGRRRPCKGPPVLGITRSRRARKAHHRAAIPGALLLLRGLPLARQPLRLAEREAELLPVPYYHVVFTLPASIGAIAFHNKAAVYDLLFRTAAETLTTIAATTREATGCPIGTSTGSRLTPG